MKSTIVILSHLSFLLPVQVQMLMFQRLVLKEMGIDKMSGRTLNLKLPALLWWQEFYLLNDNSTFTKSRTRDNTSRSTGTYITISVPKLILNLLIHPSLVAVTVI
jgi:hypothetical protein